MAQYTKGARRQGLSNTKALVSRPLRPEPGAWNMMITKASPTPPQQNPANFARNSSPDTPEVSPGVVIKEG